MEQVTDREIRAKFGNKPELQRFIRHECRIYTAPLNVVTVDTYKKILNGQMKVG
jgi:hypothetical protein